METKSNATGKMERGGKQNRLGATKAPPGSWAFIAETENHGGVVSKRYVFLSGLKRPLWQGKEGFKETKPGPH